MIGLAAATVGLTNDAAQHLEVRILTHVMHLSVGEFKILSFAVDLIF